jgi:AraC-like DNA-binding protein
MVESATTEIEDDLNCSDCSFWSTDVMRTHERMTYWREAVCRAVFGISIEAPPDHFTARISARSSGALRFATSESTPYEIMRTRREIAATPDDQFSIYLQVQGQTLSTVGDDSLELNANELAFYNGRESFRSLQGGRRSIAVVPRAMIERRAPWMLRRTPRKLTVSGSLYAELARQHLAHLNDCNVALSDSTVSMLTENLCNLVALATAPDVAVDLMQPELQLEALLAFCRQHLHEAELSPQHAADYLGISLRTLHARFRQTGQSFGRFVLASRLDACRDALRDEKQMRSNISEIAYRWGFNDLSHFNKAFRARFDMTPREWRAAVEDANAGEAPLVQDETYRRFADQFATYGRSR